MTRIDPGLCEIRNGYDKMDFTKVSKMLAEAFWSRGIEIEEVRNGASNSALVVGVFYQEQQIGYARVISDKFRFAYILDVYVDENYRKNGVAHLMINYILNHEELKNVYQWLLITKDAHGLYAGSGFKPLSRPGDWMEIRQDRPVR